MASRLWVAIVLLSSAYCSAGDGTRPPTKVPYTEHVPASDATFAMIFVPAGKFLMGSPATEKDRKPDEGPQFEVTVDAFYMQKYVVTQPEYNTFMDEYERVYQRRLKEQNLEVQVPSDKLTDAVTYPTRIALADFDNALKAAGGLGKRFPAIGMSQFAARQYTKWLSKKTGRFYRLPTEAEWEYACRAGSMSAYGFGDDPRQLDAFGWYESNSALPTGDPGYHEVGRKKPNALGLYDMHGNVAQWCIDGYDPKSYERFAGKTVNWHDCIVWPSTRYPCILRGGTFESEASDCRSAFRMHSTRKFNEHDPQLFKSIHWESGMFTIGFRMVSPVKEPTEQEKIRHWGAEDPHARRETSGEGPREIREIIPPATRPAEPRP